jgi:thiol-disulfide isomerase/thioredoxin
MKYPPRSLTIVLVCIAFWSNICSGQSVTVIGGAIDEKGQPMKFGTVYIQNMENSLMYVGAYPNAEALLSSSRSVSITEGKFQFKVDNTKPWVLYFVAADKRRTSIVLPATKRNFIDLTVVFADSRDPVTLSAVSSTDALLSGWIKADAMSSVSGPSDLNTHRDSLTAYLSRNGTQEGFTFDLGNYYRSMLDIYKKTDDRALKNFVLLNLSFLCIGDKYPVEEKYLKEALAYTPYSDPIWQYKSGIFPRGVYFGLGTFTKNKAILLPFLEGLYRQCLYDSEKPGLLYSLLYYAKYTNIPEATLYYSELLSRYPDSRQADLARKNYPVSKKLMEGSLLPDFSVANLDKKGEAITNASLKGKIYLIDFWATWCGPCVKEFPHIEELYEKYRKSGLEILTISLDKDRKEIESFRSKRFVLPWLNGYAGTSDQKLVDDFDLHAIPRLVLVDAKGIVFAEKANDLGEQNLEKTILRLLAKKESGL